MTCGGQEKAYLTPFSPDTLFAFRVSGGFAGVLLLSVPPAALIVISCARNHAQRVGPVNAFTIGLGLVLLGVALYLFGNRQMTGDPS